MKTRTIRSFWLLAGLAAMAVAPPALAKNCKGGANSNGMFILLLGKNGMHFLETRPICIDTSGPVEDYTFTIRVVTTNAGYDPKNGDITVREKNGAAGYPTIRGSNAGSGNTYKFTVTVTESQQPVSTVADDYGFWIDVPRQGKLDPMVRIIREGVSPMLRLADLQGALAEIDMSKSEAMTLIREFPDEESAAE